MTDLTQDYYWGGGDFYAQVLYELANQPDSCLTDDVNRWYNATYSNLAVPTDCSYRSDAEIQEIIDSLLNLGLEIGLDVVENYLIAGLTGLPQNQIQEAMNELRQNVLGGT